MPLRENLVFVILLCTLGPAITLRPSASTSFYGNEQPLSSPKNYPAADFASSEKPPASFIWVNAVRGTTQHKSGQEIFQAGEKVIQKNDEMVFLVESLKKCKFVFE